MLFAKLPSALARSLSFAEQTCKMALTIFVYPQRTHQTHELLVLCVITALRPTVSKRPVFRSCQLTGSVLAYGVELS
jgi:hypothetical protein